jgi:hypothetical protein
MKTVIKWAGVLLTFAFLINIWPHTKEDLKDIPAVVYRNTSEQWEKLTLWGSRTRVAYYERETKRWAEQAKADKAEFDTAIARLPAGPTRDELAIQCNDNVTKQLRASAFRHQQANQLRTGGAPRGTIERTVFAMSEDELNATEKERLHLRHLLSDLVATVGTPSGPSAPATNGATEAVDALFAALMEDDVVKIRGRFVESARPQVTLAAVVKMKEKVVRLAGSGKWSFSLVPANGSDSRGELGVLINGTDTGGRLVEATEGVWQFKAPF